MWLDVGLRRDKKNLYVQNIWDSVLKISETVLGSIVNVIAGTYMTA